jgi:branched-chain amino acid transport system permease protein
MPEQLVVFIEQLFNGVSLAGIYLLVALGLTMVFGLTRIINFAQGELVTLGAFATLALVQLRLPLPLALLLAGLLVGLLSEALDLGVFRRTLSRPINGFIVSLGLIVALEAAYALRWPGDFYTIPPVLPGDWRFGDFVFVKERVLLIAITAVICLLLFLFLERTHYGRGIRALAEDRTSAQVLGVRVGRLISVTFIIGSGLAGLAGGLLGTLFPFTAFFGSAFLLKGFAVAIVGGLGNVRGTVLAALVLALAETMGGAYVSLAWSYAILLVVMVAIILWRPYGLFRSTEQAGGDPLQTDHLLGHAAGLAKQVRGTMAGKVLAAVPHLAVAGLLVAGALAPFWLDSYRSLAFATFSLVSAMAVYSMWFAFRYAGIFSIAQAGFLGVGAYATVILTLHFQINFWEQIAAAALLGGLLAAVFSFIALRASGTYLLILLFALSELEIIVIQNWSSVTGGLIGIVLPTPPDPFFGAVSFGDPIALYYLVFVFSVLAIALLWWVSTTRFGRLLTSLRDNEMLAQSLGLNTFRYKLLALTLSGAVAGFAGAFFVYADVGIAPSYFTVNASIQYSLMMLLGGSGTVAGPMVGVLVATFLPEFLHMQPFQAQLVYGVLLVLIIVVLPTGAVGALRQLYFRLANRLALRWIDA